MQGKIAKSRKSPTSRYHNVQVQQQSDQSFRFQAACWQAFEGILSFAEKAAKPVEFGAKLDISASNGWTRLECWSFDPYNESSRLVETIERYQQREGHYPERVLADKIYRNRENLRYCKVYGILEPSDINHKEPSGINQFKLKATNTPGA